MHAKISLFFRMMALFAVLALTAACATTTGSTEGTSETFANTTDATSDLTSSTCPSEEPAPSQETEALAFTQANLGRIKTEMAAGGGEHLRALATLLGVPVSQQQTFFSITKEKFIDLYSSDQTTAEELLKKLNAEISSNPGLSR